MHRPSTSLISSVMTDRFDSSWSNVQDAVNASGSLKSGVQREIISLPSTFFLLMSSFRCERPQISQNLSLK